MFPGPGVLVLIVCAVGLAAAWGVFGAFFCSVRFGFVAPPALVVAYRLVFAVGGFFTLSVRRNVEEHCLGEWCACC